MVRFKHLVNSPAGMKGFRAKYHIPQEVALQYWAPDRVVTDRKEGEVVIPMIAFIEGGMMLPMGRVTRDYLINHKLCPYQCAPNLFRVLGSINALNEQMSLRLTWHDVVHMYELSNKGMKDDYLIAFGEWHDGLHCPTREGEPDEVP